MFVFNKLKSIAYVVDRSKLILTRGNVHSDGKFSTVFSPMYNCLILYPVLKLSNLPGHYSFLEN